MRITHLLFLSSFCGLLSAGDAPMVHPGGKRVICEDDAGGGKRVVCHDKQPCETQYGDAKDFTFIPEQSDLIPARAKKLQWGIDLGGLYENNIFLEDEGFEREGYSFFLAPDVLYRIVGDELTDHMLAATYGASLFYGDDDREWDVNHGGGLAYRFNSERTRATVQADYQHVSGDQNRSYARFGDALRLREEERNSVDRYSVTTGLAYQYTACLGFDFKYGYRQFDYDNLNDFTSHGGQIAAYYGNLRSLRFGPYFGWERSEADNQPDQDAYQVGATAKWDYSAVTSFFGQAGFENRSFDGVAAREDQESFVYSFGADWHPDNLSARLSFDRRVQPSTALNNQNYTQSAINLGISRPLFGCYTGRVIGSYAWVDYESNLAGGPDGGDEDYVSGYFELARDIFAYGRIAVYYAILDNDSEIVGRSFANDTVGFRFGLNY